ncbi:Carbon monoxide dehydrogenase medium chain [bacterium HR17]|uniref:Carbon monoxide dehydrogenase medium chain n=1 Tax=Candidatus Fervidibacter japonicus TaxID=2035412 RepID=A0A2H5XB91_9BACT|nr:Carbon monoxide dehydrogenase medium chain [bacterium HR17]
MFPAPFEYHAPATLQEALQLLAQHGGNAKVLAGGQSLVPLMKLRLSTPAVIIDLNRIANLRYIREDGDVIAIGAMTRHYDVETSELLRRRCPVLSECAAHIGDVQVRNRGTVGGSLAHADPAADYPAAILACDAEIKVVNTAGNERTVKASDFFVDLFTTALRPDELITEIRVPAFAPKTGSAYLKMEQLASGFAVCGVAAIVTLDGGVLQDVRVGITGVAPKAYRATTVEHALKGKAPDAATVEQAARHAADGVTPLDDIHADADYRAHLAKVLTKRALLKAVERARGLC